MMRPRNHAAEPRMFFDDEGWLRPVFDLRGASQYPVASVRAD